MWQRKQWTEDVVFVILRTMAKANAIQNGSGKAQSREKALSPAICRAGYFQFSAEQSFTNGCVQSRGLFWCKSGRGQFNVNGETRDLEPHDLYVLPWGRRITYIPDPSDPMFTGHVHVIPNYTEGSKWIPDVPHESNEVAFDSPDRSDGELLGYHETVRFKISSDEPIGLLLDYTIRRYLESHGITEAEGRHLGHLVVTELRRLRANQFGSELSYPEELRRMIAYIDKGYHLSPTVADLARVIGRSRSHVLKLFNKHLGISAKGFIIERQIKEARELLLSTTLSIAEIGQSVGLPDPYHFSKRFRSEVGISPSAYRQDHGPFSRRPAASSHKPAPSR